MSRAVAAALADAIETARIAFAPRFDLSFRSVSLDHRLVNSINVSCIHTCNSIVNYCINIFYCRETPFTEYLLLSPSRSSRASNSPVEAPLGAVPLDTVPSKSNLCFYSRVSARVDNFSSNNFFNFQISHFYNLLIFFIRRLPSGKAASALLANRSRGFIGSPHDLFNWLALTNRVHYILHSK